MRASMAWSNATKNIEAASASSRIASSESNESSLMATVALTPSCILRILRPELQSSISSADGSRNGEGVTLRHTDCERSCAWQ